MDLYQQIVDPTQVSESISCNLIESSKEHLVVSKGTLLQVFEVLPLSGKLKLITEYKLQGCIDDMKKVTTNESQLHYLLISLKKAKMVLLKWDHKTFEMVAVSLHYYEQFLAKLTFDNDDDTKVVFKLDPNNQSAVLLYKDSLCFLPFHQDEDEDDNMDGIEDNEKQDDNSIVANAFKDITYPSFILPASKLDSSIRNIIDITFLHNYHEPTLAVLFQPEPTWAGSLEMRKDTSRLLVLSLDLIHKSSIAIIDIAGLPYDSYKLIELTKPIMGVMLVGCNQLIHVKPNGTLTSVGVNEFYQDCTNLKSQDMSHLNLKLEECHVVQSMHGGILVFETLAHKIHNFAFGDQKSKVVAYEEISKHDLKFTAISSMTFMKDDFVFIGCEGSDSMLVKFEYGNSGSNQSIMTGAVKGDVDYLPETPSKNGNGTANDDDEDLYSDDEDTIAQLSTAKDLKYLEIKIVDILPNYGPVTSFSIAQPQVNMKVLGLPNPNYKENCIVASSGYGIGSSVSIFNPTIRPSVKSCLKFSNVNRIWTVSSESNQSDYLVTTNFDNFKTEIFKINENYKKFYTADFNGNEITLFLTKFNNDKILQITTTAIKLYDYNFHILTTLKFDVEVVFGYSYNDLILITFQDGEVASFELVENDVLKALRELKKFEADNKKKRSKEFKKKLEDRRADVKALKKFELSKIGLPKLLNDLIITTGTIVNSSLLANVQFGGVKRDHEGNELAKDESDNTKIPLFVLITADNRILLFQKEHNQKIFELNGAENLSEHLTIGLMIANKEGVPDPQIKSITVSELGDGIDKEEYAVILTVGGQIILYKLFYNGQSNEFYKINDSATLKMTGAPENAYPSGTKIERNLIPFENLSGLSCILVTGVKTYCIMKTAKSLPKIHQFTSLNSVSIATFSNDKVNNGLIFIDDHKSARIVELDPAQDLSNRLPATKYSDIISADETIKSIEYHKTSNTFILSTFKEIDYDAVDEDGNVIAGVDDTKRLKGKTFKSWVKLLSPSNWTVIDEIELEEGDLAITVKPAFLDISKTHTGFKKEYIIVGTGKIKTEDLAANGGFKIFEVIDIIPEPGKPETNHKFKLVFEESGKGAITAMCDVSGRFVTANNMKLLVRDLQDDNTVWPVAFYDTSFYVTDLKSFEDLIVLGDSAESVWLLGFDAEPYRMIMLGKDALKLDIRCLDMIVYDKQLYILAVDNDNIMHLLQYDPEDPTSQLGQKLVRKAIFKLNSETTMLKRFHKFEEFNKNIGPDKFQCIGSNLDGSFYRVAPISESTYRNFYIIQQQIIDKEFHTFGLNPKLNRLGELPSHLKSCMANSSNSIQRPILDFDIVRSFLNLNDDKRTNIGKKIGKNMNADVYRDFIDLEKTL